MRATTKMGRKISASQIERRFGRRKSITTAETNDSETQTSKNEMPYTPVNDAIWMSGSIWYCETPNKSQGNPENNRATTISRATQAAAPQKTHRARPAQVCGRIPANWDEGP